VRSRLSRGRDQLRRLMDMGNDEETRPEEIDGESMAPAVRRRRPGLQRRAA